MMKIMKTADFQYIFALVLISTGVGFISENWRTGLATFCLLFGITLFVAAFGRQMKKDKEEAETKPAPTNESR